MKWVCPKCGMWNEGRFCSNCGSEAQVISDGPRPPDQTGYPGRQYQNIGYTPVPPNQTGYPGKRVKTILIIAGSVIGAVAVFFVFMICLGIAVSEDEPATTVSATPVATASPASTPEPEPEKFLGQMSTLGAKAYMDVVSIEPYIGMGNISEGEEEPKKYNEVVCACTGTEGGTYYLLMTVADYNRYFDSAAKLTDPNNIQFTKKEFSPGKRITGKVTSADLHG